MPLMTLNVPYFAILSNKSIDQLNCFVAIGKHVCGEKADSGMLEGM